MQLHKACHATPTYRGEVKLQYCSQIQDWQHHHHKRWNRLGPVGSSMQTLNHSDQMQQFLQQSIACSEVWQLAWSNRYCRASGSNTWTSSTLRILRLNTFFISLAVYAGKRTMSCSSRPRLCRSGSPQLVIATNMSREASTCRHVLVRAMVHKTS